MNVDVRRLGPEDWPLLRAIRLRALADAPYAFGSTHTDEAGRPDEWWATSVQTLAWFVASEVPPAETPPPARPPTEEIIGLVAGLQSDSGSDCREIISMWVAASHRGGGTARSLLRAVEDWARQQSATHLLLRVSDRNDRARRFYERRGFTPTGAAEPLQSDPSASAIQMRLDLQLLGSMPAGQNPTR